MTKISISLLKRENGRHELSVRLRYPHGDWFNQGDLVDNRDSIETELIFLTGELYQRLIFEKAFLRQYFLPPARGAFTSLTPSMLHQFSGIGMYKEYLERIDSVRYRTTVADNNSNPGHKFLMKMFEKLLNGKITIERDNIFFTPAGSRTRIPLNACSSSVKELFPLYLILNRVRMDKMAVCIDEPEAHLHPDLQRKVALLLAYIVSNGGFVMATTHSDFFLNQINNLIKLHFIKNKKDRRFAAALKETGISKEFVLNPDLLGAYYFKSDKNRVHVEKLVTSEKGFPLESFKMSYENSVNETWRLREALVDDDE